DKESGVRRPLPDLDESLASEIQQGCDHVLRFHLAELKEIAEDGRRVVGRWLSHVVARIGCGRLLAVLDEEQDEDAERYESKDRSQQVPQACLGARAVGLIGQARLFTQNLGQMLPDHVGSTG